LTARPIDRDTDVFVRRHRFWAAMFVCETTSAAQQGGAVSRGIGSGVGF